MTNRSRNWTGKGEGEEGKAARVETSYPRVMIGTSHRQPSSLRYRPGAYGPEDITVAGSKGEKRAATSNRIVRRCEVQEKMKYAEEELENNQMTLFDIWNESLVMK